MFIENNPASCPARRSLALREALPSRARVARFEHVRIRRDETEASSRDGFVDNLRKGGNKMKTEQRGFTLVEIAIVLVIIGLLLGGILKGQEMIVQAKIKNVVSDLNGVTAAVSSYQNRYRALPGDDKSANARWTLTNQQGDGNGTISGKYNTSTASDESALFWLHLRLAGFPGDL